MEIFFWIMIVMMSETIEGFSPENEKSLTSSKWAHPVTWISNLFY